MRGYGLLQKLNQTPCKLSHSRQASSTQIPASSTASIRRRRDFAETLSDHLSSPLPSELSSSQFVPDSSSSSNRFVRVKGERVSDSADITVPVITPAKSATTARKSHDGKLDSFVSYNNGKRFSAPSVEPNVSTEVNTNGNRDSSVSGRRKTKDEEEAGDSPIDAKTTACIDSNDSSKSSVAEESKKNMYQIAFPVSVFIEWWITCFMNNTGHVTDLAFPLGKIHVWVAAYQRVHMEMTGHHADGQIIAALIRKLHVLQAVFMRGSFRWADTKHIHIHSPLEDNEDEDRVKSAAFQDELVQEVLLLALEPIFEARFSARSHAHRPGRDAHSALKDARNSFYNCTWFIKGSAGILEEEVYFTRIVECVARVVRDPRVSTLLKTAFLGGERSAKLGQDGKDKSQMVSSWDSCSRLKNFLCNVYLDRLDQWMDDQILSSRSRVSSGVERPCKLEYVRYGTEFLVGCKGSREDAQDIQKKLCSFFKQTYRMDYSREWKISHISDGIEFLDHVISQKVVHPIISRQNFLSNSKKELQKRPLGIALSLKASRERCCMHLKDMVPPTSLVKITDMLTVLYNWYYLADDRDKTIEYCKYYLCSAYAMSLSSSGKLKEEDVYLSQLRQAMKMLKEVKLSSDVSDCSGTSRVWIPEHEKVLKNLAWLRDEKTMDRVRLGFRVSEKASPQQHMGQVVWQFLQGRYPSKDDSYCLEPEIGIQDRSSNPTDSQNEELEESVA